MAELNLRAPEPLIINAASTSMATTLNLWLEQLEMYFLASGIAGTKRQKAILLYCGGEGLRTLHRTLADEGDTFAATKTLLNTQFKPKKNLTFERNSFYCCVQTEHETVSAYVTMLKDQARTCKFDEYTADDAITD